MTRSTAPYSHMAEASAPAIVQRATMRRPTPAAVQTAYWRFCLKRSDAWLEPEAAARVRYRDMEDPECGFYRTRFLRDGPWVPVRIWLDQEIDPKTGELLSDEIMRAEVDGYEIRDAPAYLAQRFTSLRAIIESAYWALIEERRRPDAQGDIFRATRAPIDLSRRPILP